MVFNPDNGSHTVMKINDLIYTVAINPNGNDVNITYYNNFILPETLCFNKDISGLSIKELQYTASTEADS